MKTLERKQSNTGAATKKHKHTVHFQNTASLLVDGEATQNRHTTQHSASTAANIHRSIIENDPDAVNFIKSTRRQTSPNITSPLQVSSTSRTNKARRASYTATDLISDDVAERAQRLTSSLQAHKDTTSATNRARRGTVATADIHKDIIGDSPPDLAKLRTRRQTSPNITVPLPISSARRGTVATADIHKNIIGDSPPDFAKSRTRRQTSPNITVPLPISSDDSNRRSSANRARRGTVATADIHKDIIGDSPPDFAKLRTRRQTSPNITVPLPVSLDDSNRRSSPAANRARRGTVAAADIHKDIIGDSPPDFARLRTRRQTSPNITVPLPISSDDSNRHSSPAANRARRGTFAAADIHKDIIGDSPPDFAKLRTRRQTSPNISMPLDLQFNRATQARRATHTADELGRSIIGNPPNNDSSNLIGTKRSRRGTVNIAGSLPAISETSAYDPTSQSHLANPVTVSSTSTGASNDESELSSSRPRSMFRSYRAFSNSLRNYNFSDVTSSSGKAVPVTSSSGKAVQVLTGVAAKKTKARQSRLFSLFTRKRSKVSYPKPSRASFNLAK